MPAIPPVITELYDAFHARDIERMRACWAEDAIYESPADGFRREGVDAIMEYTTTNLWVPFPDAKITVRHIVVDGNQVVLDAVLVATHTGPFSRVTDGGGIAEIPPTNRHFVGHAVDWLTIVDGLIAVDRLYFDRLELLTQLGLVPQPEAV